MPDSPKRAGLLRYAIVASMVLAMGGLSVVLFQECGASRETIERYAATIHDGATVSEAVGGTEAAELTDVLGRTRSISMGNFQAQAGTECVWVTLSLDEGSRGARFVLAEGAEGYAVIAASLHRECDCPIDHQRRCHLE